MDAWSYECGVQLSFIRPGKPNENAYIESFNGKFRDECLNEHWFITMSQARGAIEAWRIEYNTERPHSSLRNLTPQEFAQARKSVRHDDWIEIVAPSDRPEAELLFKRREVEHPAERAALRDEDIRIDIIRSIDGGVLVRYRIRGQKAE